MCVGACGRARARERSGFSPPPSPKRAAAERRCAATACVFVVLPNMCIDFVFLCFVSTAEPNQITHHLLHNKRMNPSVLLSAAPLSPRFVAGVFLRSADVNVQQSVVQSRIGQSSRVYHSRQ